MGLDGDLKKQAFDLFLKMCRYKYSYNFLWLGRPIIQFPQDIAAIQEIVWRVKPDLIVETGIAHGGSLVLWASLLELIGADGRAVGIDIEIRPHNRSAIEQHPLARRIRMIEGSSIAPPVIAHVRQAAAGCERVMIVLDSNHTHAHVREELRLYSPLVRRGSYLIILDTVVDDMPADFFLERPWGPGNNPKTAVWEFLKQNDRFEIDREIEKKLLITVAPDGYLRCVKDPL